MSASQKCTSAFYLVSQENVFYLWCHLSKLRLRYVSNGHGDTSSNPVRGCLHFT